jgi:hypothetical protein
LKLTHQYPESKLQGAVGHSSGKAPLEGVNSCLYANSNFSLAPIQNERDAVTALTLACVASKDVERLFSDRNDGSDFGHAFELRHHSGEFNIVTHNQIQNVPRSADFGKIGRTRFALLIVLVLKQTMRLLAISG